MKAMTFVWAACILLTNSASAAAMDMKAISCMFELQAEAYRFLRLGQQTLQASKNPMQAGKLKAQIKASAQELFLNVQEAKPGLQNAGMQAQYKRLEDVVSDYVSDATSSTDSQDLSTLRFKQNALVRLAAESAYALDQKLADPASKRLAMIGRVKVNVERFAYDFEMCRASCDQLLNASLADLERGLEEIHNTLPRHFSNYSYDLARNQMVFMRLAVDRRAKSASMDLAQHNLIVAGGHLWELVDEVLDSYIKAAGE